MLNTTGIEQAPEKTVNALISAGLIVIGADDRMHAAPERTKAELFCRLKENSKRENSRKRRKDGEIQ